MPTPTPPLPDARVVMIGRVDCHLCALAREVIEGVVAQTGDTFVEVDIDADPALARYTDEVPVTFVDGRQHDYWRVDEGRLRAALRAADAADRGPGPADR